MTRLQMAAMVSAVVALAMADGTNRFPRVKAELAVAQTVTVGGVSEVSPVDGASAIIAPAMPAEQAVSVQSPIVVAFAAELAEAVTMQVPELFAAALAKAESADVPALLAMALERAVSADVPAILSVALEKAESSVIPDLFAAALAHVDPVDMPDILAVAMERITEAQAPAVAAAVYAELVQSTVKGVSAAEIIKIRQEWYERFVAVGGSKAYWILRIAKERAEKGEDVSELKRAFDFTMNRWLKEED